MKGWLALTARCPIKGKFSE